jgi:hypothetical protein
MNSYFIYYFNDVTAPAPFFEVVNCRNDGHALERCADLLKVRSAAMAQVWAGERMVGAMSGDPIQMPSGARLAANPPQATTSLRQ